MKTARSGKPSKWENKLEDANGEIETLRAEAIRSWPTHASDFKDKLEEANDGIGSLQEMCNEYKDKLHEANSEINSLREKVSGCQSADRGG